MTAKYDRSIKMFDEAYAPETLDRIVSSKKINSGKFLTQAHAGSYMLQMQTIHRIPDVRSVFELGPGEHFCANNMRNIGYDYTTFDFEKTHNPTIVGDWNTFDVKRHPRKYDICCAFQVLEHFSWSSFKLNLMKLSLLSKKYIFISLPYSCYGSRVHVVSQKRQNVLKESVHEDFYPTNLPQRKYRKEYIEEFPWAVHYWEIGREGISLDTVFNVCTQCSFDILSAFHSPNPYHYFILMQIRGV
ncbi:hypothetical protein [Maridesulfovibrio sp.]|uniref:hypothetical protein n=1 Tax=Maridesulfovibrio sp. TaxID=2795000 RepID=UPI0039F0F65D